MSSVHLSLFHAVLFSSVFFSCRSTIWLINQFKCSLPDTTQINDPDRRTSINIFKCFDKDNYNKKDDRDRVLFMGVYWVDSYIIAPFTRVPNTNCHYFTTYKYNHNKKMGGPPYGRPINNIYKSPS